MADTRRPALNSATKTQTEESIQWYALLETQAVQLLPLAHLLAHFRLRIYLKEFVRTLVLVRKACACVGGNNQTLTIIHVFIRDQCGLQLTVIDWAL